MHGGVRGVWVQLSWRDILATCASFQALEVASVVVGMYKKQSRDELHTTRNDQEMIPHIFGQGSSAEYQVAISMSVCDVMAFGIRLLVPMIRTYRFS